MAISKDLSDAENRVGIAISGAYSEFLDKCYSWLMAQPSMAGATAV